MAGMLTSRQEAFCRHYSLGTSAAEAARRAGYAESTARDRAQRLLTHPGVQVRVGELRDGEAQSRAALCSQLLHHAETIRERAMAADSYATALRAVEVSLKLVQSLGLPALPSDSHDLALAAAHEEQRDDAPDHGWSSDWAARDWEAPDLVDGDWENGDLEDGDWETEGDDTDAGGGAFATGVGQSRSSSVPDEAPRVGVVSLLSTPRGDRARPPQDAPRHAAPDPAFNGAVAAALRRGVQPPDPAAPPPFSKDPAAGTA